MFIEIPHKTYSNPTCVCVCVCACQRVLLISRILHSPFLALLCLTHDLETEVCHDEVCLSV